ncbi:hypothetical protein NDR87_13630 [Nocardia sp. CDC159]|uniref:Uncharacterized protein n=1 Tax=Nocardia pulmonis TaxID=2951408 RepID=A0A9X2IY32_9NOCA|nr:MULTISPECIES: hypothetical protein [Nocardia]MCM6774535.1 hypothetical protein [Nocardia pulmonis]MCM6787399.1 hypothetical protein [Nocardia sp. CDC159]
MESVPRKPYSTRAPIVARLHRLPTAQGLTVPFITRCHRGQRIPIWGSIDPGRMRVVWQLALCQVCAEPFDHRVVVMVRPGDWLRRIGPEAGLHPECAAYSIRACPMLASRMAHYRSTPALARVVPCGDPLCLPCRWASHAAVAESDDRTGKPADAWYAVWLAASDYTVIDRPGDEHTPALTGVQLAGVRPLAIRKVRDAAPGAEHADRPNALDVAAAALAFDRILNR